MPTTPIQQVGWFPLTQRNQTADPNLMTGQLIVDFASGSPQVLDFTLPTGQGVKRISAIAGAYIDNSQNLFSISLVLSGSNQRLVVGPQSMALLPFLNVNPEKISVSSGSAIAIVPINFLNFRPEPMIWSAATGGTGPTAPLYVRDLSQNNMTWGNVALGADQIIVPANAARQTIFLKASGNNVAQAFYNFGAVAAANTFGILDPGDYISLGDPGNVDPRDLHIFGTAPDRVSFGYV